VVYIFDSRVDSLFEQGKRRKVLMGCTMPEGDKGLWDFQRRRDMRDRSSIWTLTRINNERATC
jgi:hypothetical protein